MERLCSIEFLWNGFTAAPFQRILQKIIGPQNFYRIALLSAPFYTILFYQFYIELSNCAAQLFYTILSKLLENALFHRISIELPYCAAYLQNYIDMLQKSTLQNFCRIALLRGLPAEFYRHYIEKRCSIQVQSVWKGIVLQNFYRIALLFGLAAEFHRNSMERRSSIELPSTELPECAAFLQKIYRKSFCVEFLMNCHMARTFYGILQNFFEIVWLCGRSLEFYGIAILRGFSIEFYNNYIERRCSIEFL